MTTNEPPLKVLHVITDLGQGGAEGVLYNLILATQSAVTNHVVSLHGDGVYGERLRQAGVPVDVLAMPRGRLTLAGMRHLRQIIVRERPDVVQTRLYHASLLGGLAAWGRRGAPVVWALHSTSAGTLRQAWKTHLVRLACGAISRRIPSAIVADAHKSVQIHAALGYPAAKTVVVPNGVDLSRFSRDDEARARLREEWGVPADTVLLGCVARWHPMKDHGNLFGALATLRAEGRPVRCAFAGGDMTQENDDLMRQVRQHGIEQDVLLLGPRSDVPAVMNAIDLHILPSSTESQPVAVLEAMACETPCVVTNVGDAAHNVGKTGWVVPPSDSEALARGIGAAVTVLVEQGREALGRACRERIVQQYSMEAMTDAYLALWHRVRLPPTQSGH